MRGKKQLADLLDRWLVVSNAATIGNVGAFGASPFIRIELGEATAVLNTDTKRTAVEGYVRDVRRRGPNVAWHVIANRRGRVNKVVFREDKQATPGWFCYLTLPVDEFTGAVMAERNDSLYVVQFPHPGAEHNPKQTNRMAWNTKTHARKFLRSPGRYLDRAGALHDGDLVFWGSGRQHPGSLSAGQRTRGCLGSFTSRCAVHPTGPGPGRTPTRGCSATPSGSATASS